MSLPIEQLLMPRYMVIADYPNYEISDNGEIRNVNTGLILKPYITKKGYYSVKVQINKSQKGLYLHRLVAFAYVPNPKNKPCVNHKDGNKKNNHYTNLEWCTYKENSDHSFDNGLQRSGVDHYHSKLSLEDIWEIKGLVGNNLPRSEIAKIYNVSETTIQNIMSGKSYKQVKDFTPSLLTPRFKVIDKYPFSSHKIGNIITTSNNSSLYRILSEFPNIFYKMPWYEGRKVEELPEYIKWPDGKIEHVYFDENGVATDDYTNEFSLIDIILPATEAEYISHINKTK